MSDVMARVGVLAASPSELPIMRQAGLILEKFGIAHEIRIMSSSRNPDLVDEYARTAFERGLKVVICSTGMSGHLAAAVAARTILPVIGVPIATGAADGGQRGARHHGADAHGRAGGDGRRRVLRERRGPGRRDHRDRRHRRAGRALEVQGRPGGGPQALIPRYSLPEMAAVWSDEARLANWLEIELLAVEAWAELGRIPAEDAAAIRERAAFTVEAVEERERVTRHDVAAFVDVVADSVGPRGPVDPLRADVLGRVGHRVRPAAPGRRRPAARAVGGLLGCREETGARAPRHADDGAFARDPRGADVVRAQARGLGVRAGSRPGAPPPRARP